jgi:hypothetical protein
MGGRSSSGVVGSGLSKSDLGARRATSRRQPPTPVEWKGGQESEKGEACSLGDTDSGRPAWHFPSPFVHADAVFENTVIARAEGGPQLQDPGVSR